LQSVDDSVGRLVGWLDEHGLGTNTVVIYTSDQGFFLGDHGLYDKRFMYEESLRMPFLVRWPAATRPNSVQEALVINPDFAPTFLELAGVPVPADMQGRSLVPCSRAGSPRTGARASITVITTIPATTTPAPITGADPDP
jgi:arylsulfatase A-like enzyme